MATARGMTVAHLRPVSEFQRPELSEEKKPGRGAVRSPASQRSRSERSWKLGVRLFAGGSLYGLRWRHSLARARSRRAKAAVCPRDCVSRSDRGHEIP